MWVLTHIKKLDDCFAQFPVRVSCPCDASREIEPEALTRLVGCRRAGESAFNLSRMLGHSRSTLIDTTYAHSMQSGLASAAESVTARALGIKPQLRVIDGGNPREVRPPLDETWQRLRRKAQPADLYRIKDLIRYLDIRVHVPFEHRLSNDSGGVRVTEYKDLRIPGSCSVMPVLGGTLESR